MPRTLLLSLLLWAFEVFFVIGLVSDDWLRAVQQREAHAIAEQLGTAKASALQQQAQRRFDHLFVQTGVQATVYRYFIPSEQERLNSVGFEQVGQDRLFPFIAERLQVIWDTITLCLRRLGLLQAWWPYLWVTVTPCILDGILRRQRKQSNFDYSSPLIHRLSGIAMVGILYLAGLSLLLPFAIAPDGVPVGCGLLAWSVNCYLTQMQKRV